MYFSIPKLLAATQLFSFVLGTPLLQLRQALSGNIDCSSPVKGLSLPDCQYMSQIGIAAQGVNSFQPNDLIWVGKQGPNLFNFKNKSGVKMILIFWNYPIGDYAKLFMSATGPQVSYSLAPGQKVTISVAHGVSGGWAGLYDHQTTLSPYGLVQNTWGEFTTDPANINGAVNEARRTHVDVSKLVYMKGNKMSIRMDKKPGGCVSDFQKCYFECIADPVTCGRQGEYRLVNCQPDSQRGANYGLLWGQPEGGCAGTEMNGYVTVTM